MRMLCISGFGGWAKCLETLILLVFLKIGAGEGNRTLISGLGSPHSTTEPHPPTRQARLQLGKFISPGKPALNRISFYQTARRLATGLRGEQTAGASATTPERNKIGARLCAKHQPQHVE